MMIAGGRVVAVNFLPGSGGKFIQNCLALSQHCVFKQQAWATQQLVHGADYATKLAWALTTVPADKDLISQWLSYELPDDLFYHGWLQDGVQHEFPPLIYHLAQAGLWTTYTAHSHGSAELCCEYWPCVRFVNVWGDQFAQQWLPVKNAGLATDMANWQPAYTVSADRFDFDFDRTFWNPVQFVGSMHNLYSYLEFQDFDAVLPVLTEFHRVYLELHK